MLEPIDLETILALGALQKDADRQNRETMRRIVKRASGGVKAEPPPAPPAARPKTGPAPKPPAEPEWIDPQREAILRCYEHREEMDRRRKAAIRHVEFQREREQRMALTHQASARDKLHTELVNGLAAGTKGLLSAAREHFRLRGVDTDRIDNDTLARAALGDGHAAAEMGLTIMAAGDGSYGGPGDFPNILSAAANKILEQPADDAVFTYKRWTHAAKPVPDFKPSTIINAGEFGEFPHHVDGDDFDQSTFGTEAGWLQVESYGDEFKLTPAMIVGDDLGAFEEALLDKQTAHDLTLNRLCVNLLVQNPALTDTYALFHSAQHGNDRAAGAAPSTNEFSALRLLLRKQTGVSGARKMGYPLDLVLVPEDLETTTEKALRVDLNVQPTAASDTEPFRGQLDYAVEPMLGEHSAVKWYGFTRPKRARSIIVCHQVGFEKMKTRGYYVPQSNCRVWQFEGRFAAAVRNHRGVVRNAGTGA